jgi:hypothetical protein
MPSFSEWQDVETEINIDVDEFYEEMNSSERKEMYKLLADDGYGLDYSSTNSSWEFDQAIIVLQKSYLLLTKEETEAIIALAKRF